jgi:hypothetical protein
MARRLRAGLGGIEPAESGREFHEPKVLRWEEIAPARLIDHSQLTVPGGLAVGHHALDLPDLEGRWVLAVVHAEPNRAPVFRRLVRTLNVAARDRVMGRSLVSASLRPSPVRPFSTLP